jgi:ketosteroid isomerase-like protein
MSAAGSRATVEIVERFYAAFAARDAEGMARCYAPDVVFSDPAFGELRGAEAGDMWRMLLSRAADLSVRADAPEATSNGARTRWYADYTFSTTGLRVHNVVEASCVVVEGLIREHRDHFDFWRWSRQALGAPGALLGWTPFLQNKVRSQARAGLAKWRDRG